VTKEDAMKWFQVKYEGVILNKSQQISWGSTAGWLEEEIFFVSTLPGCTLAHNVSQQVSMVWAIIYSTMLTHISQVCLWIFSFFTVNTLFAYPLIWWMVDGPSLKWVSCSDRMSNGTWKKKIFVVIPCCGAFFNRCITYNLVYFESKNPKPRTTKTQQWCLLIDLLIRVWLSLMKYC
jgi:hypothetical protein